MIDEVVKESCSRCGDFINDDCVKCSLMKPEKRPLANTMLAFVTLVFTLQALTLLLSFYIADAMDLSVLEMHIYLWSGPFSLMLLFALPLSTVIPYFIMCSAPILFGLVLSSLRSEYFIALIFTVIGMLMWLSMGLHSLTTIR